MATQSEGTKEKMRDKKVSTNEGTDGGEGGDGFKKPRDPRRATAVAYSKIRNNSRSRSPKTPLSPNRFQPLLDQSENDQEWECKICATVFQDENDKMLECMKCDQHFCIECLGKTPEQYEIMKDIMWFCVPCRKEIERSIEIDKQIEEKCNAIKEMYENRLTELEARIDTKVNEADVRKIAKEVFKEEINVNQDLKQITQSAVDQSLKELHAEPQVLAAVAQQNERPEEEITRTGVNEINEQKARERNFVIHGLPEPAFASKEDRASEEKARLIKIAKVCQVEINQKNISKVHRLGKNDPKENRPVLVCLDDLECKISLFRNFNKVRELDPSEDNNENVLSQKEIKEFKELNISHDMTKQQREEDKRLRAEAKKLQEQSQGKFRYSVRGPPWARKMVKLPAAKEDRGEK